MPGNHFAIEVKNLKALRKELEDKKVVIKEAVVLSDRERFYLINPFDTQIRAFNVGFGFFANRLCPTAFYSSENNLGINRPIA